MKLALISDTHGMLPDVEDFEGADAVIHAGDIGPDYSVEKWIHATFHPWVHALPCPFYGTLGNHDFPTKWQESDQINIDLSENIGGRNVWFSPWSPLFESWAWMRSEPELTEIYAKIPVDTHIIVSHTPPYQLCDMTDRGEPVGSKALRVRMQELPDLTHIICGHIHGARGIATLNSTTILNVASVDEEYRPLTERITWLEI